MQWLFELAILPFGHIVVGDKILQHFFLKPQEDFGGATNWADLVALSVYPCFWYTCGDLFLLPPIKIKVIMNVISSFCHVSPFPLFIVQCFSELWLAFLEKILSFFSPWVLHFTHPKLSFAASCICMISFCFYVGLQCEGRSAEMGSLFSMTAWHCNDELPQDIFLLVHDGLHAL